MATVGFNLVGVFKGLSLTSTSTFLKGDLDLLRPGLSNSSFVGGNLDLLRHGRSISVSFRRRMPLTIQMAHKKGAGSTKNSRDSKSKRLGVKIYGEQLAQPGSIIVRQRGTKFHPGNNVGMGKDHTIYSLIDGLVKFEKYGPDRKKISVYPRVEQPENPNSYRARKREYFRLQRERKKARREGLVSPQLVLASKEAASEVNPLC